MIRKITKPLDYVGIHRRIACIPPLKLLIVYLESPNDKFCHTLHKSLTHLVSIFRLQSRPGAVEASNLLGWICPQWSTFYLVYSLFPVKCSEFIENTSSRFCPNSASIQLHGFCDESYGGLCLFPLFWFGKFYFNLVLWENPCGTTLDDFVTQTRTHWCISTV